MKRRVMVASSMLLAISLGLSGCGGGVEEGAPKDLTPGVPLDSVKGQMSPGTNKPPPPPKVDVAPTATGSRREEISEASTAPRQG